MNDECRVRIKKLSQKLLFSEKDGEEFVYASGVIGADNEK